MIEETTLTREKLDDICVGYMDAVLPNGKKLSLDEWICEYDNILDDNQKATAIKLRDLYSEYGGPVE